MKLAYWADFRDLTIFAANHLSLRLLSPSYEDRLAALIGDLTYAFRKSKCLLIGRALSLVLGSELTPHQTKRLTKEIIQNSWKDRFILSAINRRSTRQRVSIIGLEHVYEALGRGHGVILWESTFGNRLLAKSVLADKGFLIWQAHARHHGGSTSWVGRHIVQSLYRRAVSRLYAGIIDMEDHSFGYLRKLVELLKNNSIVCISALGGMGQNFVSVELLGTTAELPTGAISLAKMTGAPIVPVLCFRDGDGNDKLVLETPIRLQTNKDKDEAPASGIEQYARLLESYIVRYPNQWHLWHVHPGRSLQLTKSQ